MEFPMITAYVAGILGILQFILMMAVGVARGPAGVSLGDGGNEALQRNIRRHGNLAENAPIFILLLGLLELANGNATWVFYLGVVFIVARFAHALALSGIAAGILRPVGAFGTLIPGITAAVMLLLAAQSM